LPLGRSGLPRTVLVLGLVSMFNDMASEMITPLLPVFLTTVLGAGPAVVGLVEGVAQATASVIKLISGWLADRGWNPKLLVVGGYTTSNTARPLIGFALGWTWVLVLRFFDRVGKGLRDAPRDALISSAVDRSTRGWAFGYHRAMDHGGAIIGPLIAFALLAAGLSMTHVFMASVIPGVLVVALLVLGLPPTAPTANTGATAPTLHWRQLDHRLRALVLATGGLALATTPEVFLVLWASSRGLAIHWVPLIWAAASAAKVVVVAPAGWLSDRVGRLPIVISGWLVRIALLVLLALSSDGVITVWVLFLAYAASIAFTEPAERALIGDFAPSHQRATAFGLYHLVSGLFALPGAVLFGAVWQGFGVTAAFLMAAMLTALSAIVLLLIARR
jgi:MFS family permease